MYEDDPASLLKSSSSVFEVCFKVKALVWNCALPLPLPQPPPANLDSLFLYIEDVMDVSSRLLSLLDQKRLQPGHPDFLQTLCKPHNPLHPLLFFPKNSSRRRVDAQRQRKRGLARHHNDANVFVEFKSRVVRRRPVAKCKVHTGIECDDNKVFDMT